MASEPKSLPHVLWKLEHGFDAIGADHVTEIVKWAKALEAENTALLAELADAVADTPKKAKVN